MINVAVAVAGLPRTFAAAARNNKPKLYSKSIRFFVFVHTSTSPTHPNKTILENELHESFDDPSVNMQLVHVEIPPHFTDPSTPWPESLLGQHPDCFNPNNYLMMRWMRLDEARKRYEIAHNMTFDRTLQIRTDIALVRGLNLLEWMKPNTIYWFLMQLGATNMWWNYSECPLRSGAYNTRPVGSSVRLISKAPPGFPKECISEDHCFPVMVPEALGIQPIESFRRFNGFTNAQFNTWMLEIWLANISLAVQSIGWYHYIRE
eukprot:c19412_g1_i3.p1 GENE.c19412_g1_i3~~c19412_g1_i3.p1  ORF type:complete len:278 (-),score=43.94 c19412_g1_i3:30-815(-)